MPLPNWGPLEKSQDDSEKIEEAINRLIAAHNDNPDAHTGEGQSLQSHKASEIIDHAVKSIIADKIGEFEVKISKLDWDKRYYRFDFVSMDGWKSDGGGAYFQAPGQLTMRSNNTLNSYMQLWTENDELPVQFSTKNPVFATMMKVYQTTSQIIYFGAGMHNENFIGFKIVNNTLYACHYGTSEHLTEITGITLTNANTYKAVLTSGSKIEFYVNDVLKATHTTDLPTSEVAEYVFDLYIQTTAAAYKYMLFGFLVFYQDV